ncbi:LysR family transcriptional regulator [Dactylosporangium aurantiacum]|uniref:LysR family transcriptional regulator n=1 Tax=Dactylosporangium aurantiacum TaxID=35754 RepID=A0A9Q9ILG5_9ACTN|nr:LysR family transcriptional regulator [Dactylosporangium aurantiacum]MDG6104394.1 LysR family transcriptional regulator [Dactylosporangium aurantiacum]UWZ56017.1 LysR family transcriptional regulator [Dactylosporangium aurantiacum]
MELRRLRYFAALAEELHFTRAAARLRIAQPALSQQVGALEREVGARLVERRRGGCALTPVGVIVAAEAAALLAQAAAAEQRIAAAVLGQGGRLRLAYTRSARGGCVDELIERFRAAHPNVEVVPETGWTAPNVAGLLAGRYDAAFVRPPVDDPGIRWVRVGTEELLIALPAGHPLAARRRVPRELLRGEPAVMWPRDNGPGMHDRIVAQIWPTGKFTLARHEPDDEQLLRAVAAGGVVAAVPEGRARALRLPGVVLRRCTGPTPTVDIGLAWAENTTNPVVRGLIGLVP